MVSRPTLMSAVRRLVAAEQLHTFRASQRTETQTRINEAEDMAKVRRQELDVLVTRLYSEMGETA